MSPRGPDVVTGGRFVVASLVGVLVAGVLLPWVLADAGIRWSAGQAALVTGVAVVVALVVVGRYARRWGGGRKRVRVAAYTLVALVAASAGLIATRARVDQLRGQFADATMSASPDGTVLTIDGYIGDDFVADLEARLARLPQLRRIDITSAGGLVEDSLRAGEAVRRRSLRVRAVGQCSSGCVLVWASAPVREVEVSAVIGVHRVRLDPEGPEAWDSRMREHYEPDSLALLRAAGFSEALLALRATTATDDMYYIDAAELLAHGVQTHVVDAEGRPLTLDRVRRLLGKGDGSD